jgi:hypothetical protein
MSGTQPTELVTVQQEDFLEQDPQLRGQNYCCVSFIHPGEVIQKKEAYFFGKMIEQFSADMKELFAALKVKYTDDVDGINAVMDRFDYVFNQNEIHSEYLRFVENNPKLEEEYFEKNNFQTTIHGFKMRGAFDTLREAQVRAEVLKRKDPNFNIFIAQVGCWCPWAPNPSLIEDQEYAETHLNTLMKKYKDEQTKKDIFFEQRKAELTRLALENKPTDPSASTSTSAVTIEPIEDSDPWLDRRTSDSQSDK